jgi:sensor histidine kinase regulating citrate/malate metabolism
VTLHAARNRLELRVCDTGRAIPARIAERLFKEPIERTREEGLSIGLFQATRQAKAAGFRLELVSNEDGKVCFRLSDSG